MQWTCELLGGMRTVFNPMRTGDECCAATGTDIPFKAPIRVVQIRNNELVSTEIIAPLLRKFSLRDEERREIKVVQGKRALSAQIRESSVRQHLHFLERKAQRTNQRQRENEIAQRAAAKNEGAFNRKTMRAR